MIRVTQIVSHLFAECPAGWLQKLGYAGKRTEKQVFKWSGKFGTIMHSWCLEGIGPKKPTKIMKKCKEQFDLFCEEYYPRTTFTEKSITGRDEFGDPIYTGTPDWGARIKGRHGLIDLKFYSCWRWWLKFRIPRKKDIDAVKAAKTNLQTKLYEAAMNEEKFDFRAMLWITPDFYVYKEFSREPKKLDAALEFASSQKNQSLNF